MDQKKSARTDSLVNLIESVLQGTASEAQRRELDARLLADAEDRKLYLHRVNLHSALRRQFAYDTEGQAPAQFDLTGTARDSGKTRGGLGTRISRRSWASVAAAAAVLIAGVYFLRPSPGPQIATITEMNGALQWTGDGGKVVGDLQSGHSLPGGTLESLSADSWAVLTFRDASTVTVSGQSTLTISENQQKEIYLRQGSVSASVVPQPQGRSMLIHTPTARLEVLGTQLNVDVDRTSTALRVNEGRVRATRLADGSVADVRADHQVVVSASRRTGLQVRRRPKSVRSWRSSLPGGVIYGQWIPGDGPAGGALRAAAVLLNPGKKPITLHLATIRIARCPDPPVVPVAGGRFRIRGRAGASGDVYFGLTMKHVNGGFAGKYVAARKLDLTDKSDRRLEIELPLEEFRPQEKEFPGSPVGLELVDWWCFTYNQDAGLSIAGVELLPPAPAGVATQPTSKPSQVPLMDIWSAAAQGNVQAVKRHLAAGAEINAAFVAPGIPASGATPLHLAVLFNQSEMVRFLVSKGADPGTRARDEHGGTPLHWAAALGNIEMAERLIESGADVNAADNNGFTPLNATNYDRESRRKAKLKIAELLRRKGGKYAKERKE